MKKIVFACLMTFLLAVTVQSNHEQTQIVAYDRGGEPLTISITDTSTL